MRNASQESAPLSAVRPPAAHAPAAKVSPVLTRLLWCAVAAVVAVGLAAMAWLSPRVLYADPWRFTQKLLEMPWPSNVLVSDNGHREILPNLVRYAELCWLHGNQWLQIGTGMGLALATVWLLARILKADALAPSVRAAATLVGVLSIFWLGSQRALTHGNESVHAYLITVALMAGVALLLRGDRRGAVLAAVCGVAATFSFGSGVAVFVGLAAVLAVRRAPVSHWLPLIAGLLVAVGLHLGMGRTGMPSQMGLVPLAQLDVLLRWLASPFIYLAWPALDPAAAQQLPFAPVRSAVHAVAIDLLDGGELQLSTRLSGRAEALDGRAMRKWLARQPLDFPVVLAGAGGVTLTRSLGNINGGLPFTILLDAKGKAQQRKIGELSQQDLEQWAAWT